MSRLFFIPRRRAAEQSSLLLGALVISISFGFTPRCLAQPTPKPAAAPGANPSALVQKTLPSGLRMIVQPRPGTALVSVAVSVRAGTAMETAQNSGTAHFIEHLVFKGTVIGKPGDLDAQIESLGGELTARTSRDQTLYTATVPQQNWQKALPVFADLLLRPAFRADDMASERRVIVREQAAALTEPARTGFGQLAGFAYPENSAYRLPLMGTDDAFARLTPDDLTAFWKQWYTPQNMTLVVVGDVSPSDVETLAASLFPAVPGTASVLPAVTPPQAEPVSAPVAVVEPADGFCVAPKHHRSRARTAGRKIAAARFDKRVFGIFCARAARRAGKTTSPAARLGPLSIARRKRGTVGQNARDRPVAPRSH